MKVLLFVLAVVRLVQCIDETLSERTFGSDVVEAVCTKIDSSCIFEEDKLFLRRIAFVETIDGSDPNTYRNGYFGGIWQVDQAQFLETQQDASLNTKKTEIRNKFKIDWSRVTWKDLLKPFYSGLAARLYMQLKVKYIPRSIEDQAGHYSQDPVKKTTYVVQSKKLESGCKGGAADVMFVVDESGSIGETSFDRMKEFITEVISSLNVGPDAAKHTRVSLLKFSMGVSPVFKFNEFVTKSAYVQAVNSMSYIGAGTPTHLALNYLHQIAFSERSGARPLSKGIPRIAIVITDGQSDAPTATAVEAVKVHQAGITVLAVGVGSGVNLEELATIATAPHCKNVMLLDSFLEIQSLNDAIEKKTCSAPVILKPDDAIITPIPSGENKPCKIEIGGKGTSIEFGVRTAGTVQVYCSRDNVPSSVFYEVKMIARFVSPAVMFYSSEAVSVTTYTSYVYCLVEGDSQVNVDVTIITRSGDYNPCKRTTCPTTTLCTSRPNWTYECIDPTVPDTTIHNCGSLNPCTPENEALKRFYFLCDVIGSFTQCNQRAQCQIIPCPKGLVWDGYLRTCVTPATYTTTTKNFISTKPLPSTPAPVTPSGFGYDCERNNPCTPLNSYLQEYYFPHDDPGKFVQCSEYGQCFVVSCPPGHIWNMADYTCTPPPY